MTAGEIVSAPTRSGPSRNTTNPRLAGRLRPAVGGGRSEPPPPYQTDRGSPISASSSQRMKRRKLSNDELPFNPTSSILIRRVENGLIPFSVKDEDESDVPLSSPSKQAVTANPRKRSQVVSDDEEGVESDRQEESSAGRRTHYEVHEDSNEEGSDDEEFLLAVRS